MLIQINSLQIYRNQNFILKNINFNPSDRIIGVVGSSGSGKSVFAKAIAGLIPTGFKISYDVFKVLGVTSSKLSPLLGNRISYIPQDAHSALNPQMQIGTQISEMVNDKELILSKLASIGFEDPERIYKAYPYELSGGMAQRTLILMMTILSPKIIIADEPSSALDYNNTQKIMDMLISSTPKDGMLILISHDMEVISEYCEQIYVFGEGKLIENGNFLNLKHSNNTYVKKLISSIY